MLIETMQKSNRSFELGFTGGVKNSCTAHPVDGKLIDVHVFQDKPLNVPLCIAGPKPTSDGSWTRQRASEGASCSDSASPRCALPVRLGSSLSEHGGSYAWLGVKFRNPLTLEYNNFAGHMHPPFFSIMDEIQDGLRYLFQTSSKYVLLISGTGHAGEHSFPATMK